MLVLVPFTIGLVFWVVATGLGVKSFDAFLVTMALVMLGAIARMVMPFVRERILP